MNLSSRSGNEDLCTLQSQCRLRNVEIRKIIYARLIGSDSHKRGTVRREPDKRRKGLRQPERTGTNSGERREIEDWKSLSSSGATNRAWFSRVDARGSIVSNSERRRVFLRVARTSFRIQVDSSSPRCHSPRVRAGRHVILGKRVTITIVKLPGCVSERAERSKYSDRPRFNRSMERDKVTITLRTRIKKDGCENPVIVAILYV